MYFLIINNNLQFNIQQFKINPFHKHNTMLSTVNTHYSCIARLLLFVRIMHSKILKLCLIQIDVSNVLPLLLFFTV